MEKKTRGWTKERRKAQSERLKQARPWEKSTGPRTAEGKAAVAQNAYRHGMRSAEIAELCRLLRRYKVYMRAVMARAGLRDLEKPSPRNCGVQGANR